MWHSLQSFPSEFHFPVSTPPWTPYFLSFSWIVPVAGRVLVESWSGCIYMETIEHAEVISPSYPLFPPHPLALLSCYLFPSLRIAVPLEKRIIDPARSSRLSTVECREWSPDFISACEQQPSLNAPCLHIISSSTFAPLSLHPSIQRRPDVAHPICSQPQHYSNEKWPC